LLGNPLEVDSCMENWGGEVEEEMYGVIRQYTHREMYHVPGHSKIILACISALDQMIAILPLFGT